MKKEAYKTGENDPFTMMGAGEKMYVQNVEVGLRHAFVRKVFALLTVQLLITFGIVLAFATSVTLQEWSASNRWAMWVAFGVSFVMLIGISCTGIAVRHPHNLIALFFYTVAFSVFLGFCASTYSTSEIFRAIGITTGISLLLGVFAVQTKIDVTSKGLYLYAALNVLILYAIISWFFPAPTQEMVNIYNGLGALVFSGYIVYDTQLIVGGKHRAYQFGLDDYVVACLNIYLDIVNLFLIILSCGGGNRD